MIKIPFKKGYVVFLIILLLSYSSLGGIAFADSLPDQESAVSRIETKATKGESKKNGEMTITSSEPLQHKENDDGKALRKNTKTLATRDSSETEIKANNVDERNSLDLLLIGDVSADFLAQASVELTTADDQVRAIELGQRQTTVENLPSGIVKMCWRYRDHFGEEVIQNEEINLSPKKGSHQLTLGGDHWQTDRGSLYLTPLYRARLFTERGAEDNHLSFASRIEGEGSSEELVLSAEDTGGEEVFLTLTKEKSVIAEGINEIRRPVADFVGKGQLSYHLHLQRGKAEQIDIPLKIELEGNEWDRPKEPSALNEDEETLPADEDKRAADMSVSTVRLVKTEPNRLEWHFRLIHPAGPLPEKAMLSLDFEQKPGVYGVAWRSDQMEHFAALSPRESGKGYDVELSPGVASHELIVTTAEKVSTLPLVAAVKTLRGAPMLQLEKVLQKPDEDLVATAKNKANHDEKELPRIFSLAQGGRAIVAAKPLKGPNVHALGSYTEDAKGIYPSTHQETITDQTVTTVNPQTGVTAPSLSSGRMNQSIEYSEGWTSQAVSPSSEAGKSIINLRVDGREANEQVDIVMVMANAAAREANNESELVKSAAETFIDEHKGLENVRLALIVDEAKAMHEKVVEPTFAPKTWMDASEDEFKTTDVEKEALKSCILHESSAHSVPKGGLREAIAMLNRSQATKKYVVLLSDAIPGESPKITAVGDVSGVAEVGHNRENRQVSLADDSMGEGLIMPEAKRSLMSSDAKTDKDEQVTGLTPEDFTAMEEQIHYAIPEGQISNPIGEHYALAIRKGTKPTVSYPWAPDPDADIEVTMDEDTAQLPDIEQLQVRFDGSDLKIEPVKLLGKGNWLNIRYKVRLRTEAPSYEPGKFYAINGRTVLIPNVEAATLRELDFYVPSARDALPPVQSFAIKTIDGKSSTPLAEATFRLIKPGDEAFIPREVSGAADGLAVFKDLPNGQYEMTEVVAPEGYQKTDARFEVIVDGEGVQLLVNGEPLTAMESEDGRATFVVANYAVHLPLTGSESDGKLSLIFAIIIMFGAYIVYRSNVGRRPYV